MKFVEKLKEKQKNPFVGAPITMAFLGDSVTQGCFEIYPTGEESVQTEFRYKQGYHTKLRNLLEIVYPSVPINMIHAGISGDRAPGGLERLERDVIRYRPDLTVVSFGLNDSSSGEEGLKTYENALREILKKLLASGTEVIFLTPNLPADKVSFELPKDWREKFSNIPAQFDDFLRYMDTARAVCAELGVPVCDCSKKWEILRENGVDIVRLLSNRINHPTEEMYWMFANSLFDMIMGF